ncbi:MAG: glycoside hydrolase family 20 zincin-like fold domain-containing protein, partial [Thermoplasmata archaeon]
MIYIPVLTFTEEETGKNWFANPWGGGECKAERIVDEKDEKFKAYLRVTFKDAQMTLSNPKLFEKVSVNWKDKPVQGFYFWVRFQGEHTDKINIQYVNFYEGKNYNYSNRLPVIPGDWQKIEIPLGGFPVGRHTHPFDIKQLQQIYFTIYKASGILDIGEIGIVQKFTLITPQILNELVVPSLTKEIKIDGKIETQEWSDSAELELKLPEEDFLCKDKKPKENTKVLLKWDGNGIFIGAIMKKEDIKKLKANYTSDSTEIWKDECLELYFLPPGMPRTISNMRKYAINANGKIGPHHFGRDKDKGYIISAQKYSDRWELEFFLPWKALDMNPKENPFLNFNVTRTTYGGEKIEERTGWTTTKWDGLYDFGILYLLPKGEKLKRTITDFGFGRIKTNYYILRGKSDMPLNYKLWVFSTKELLYTKEDVVDKDFVIPLIFEIKNLDNYYVQFMVYSEKNILVDFFEVRFVDSPEFTFERLPLNSIALFPEPKEFELKNGKKQIKDGANYYLTDNKIDFCGDVLKEELKKFYGISIKPSNSIKNADIVIDFNFKDKGVIDLLKKKNLLDKFEKIKYDGYLLVVDEDKIIITAKEKRGVLYGVNAFLDLIKMTTREIGPDVYVNYCIVADWPDFKIRFLTDDWFGFYRAQKISPSLYMSMLEKFPLKFRYNNIAIWHGDFLHWQCAPSIRLTQGWTVDEFKGLVKFLNKRYVPVSPFINSHGHMEWLLRYPEYAYLREDGDIYTLCTKHPDTYKVLFSFYDELIKLTGEDTENKPEYFIVGLDEVRWQTFNVSPEKRCKYCAGIPKNMIFLEHIHKLYDYLKSKGFKMVMYSDMLTEEHNGLNEFKCALIRDKLPKNVIMAHWSILDYHSIPRFKALGIENWKIDTAYKVDRLNEDMITGRGFGIYTYNWHLSTTRAKTGPSYGPMAQALYANATWNIFPDHDDSTWMKYEKKYGNFLMYNWSRKPLLSASKEIKTIDISEAVNTPVIDKDGNGWFGLGEKTDLSLMDFSVKEVEGIPVKFTFKNNIPMCIKLKNKQDIFQIKIGDKLASLILLHASHIDEKDISTFSRRENYKDNP